MVHAADALIQAIPDSQAILAEHAAEIRRIGKRVVADIIEIGARLTECKRICGHGNWLPWLEREFGWSDKTAERFMSVHALAGKFDNLSNLEVPVSSLYLLAAPSTPEPARTEIIERAESGEHLRHEEVRAIIAAYSPEAVLQAARELGEDDAQQGRSINTGVAMCPHAERGLDLYETPAEAVRALLDVEPLAGTIWEPACGRGAIVSVLRAAGHRVIATDIESYGCPDSLGGVDFLTQTCAPKGAEIILTNPPFMYASDFVRHALALVPRVVMLLRLAFLESAGRCDILDGGQFARLYPFIDRVQTHRDGWQGPRNGNPMAFAWYVWDRDHRGLATVHRIWCRPADEDEEAEPPPDPVAAADLPAEAAAGRADIDEEFLLKNFRTLATSQRRRGPLPKVLIDSGDGYKEPEQTKLPRLPPHNLPAYQRVWDRLSKQDQETLAEYVSESGIGSAPCTAGRAAS